MLMIGLTISLCRIQSQLVLKVFVGGNQSAAVAVADERSLCDFLVREVSLFD